MAGLITVIIVVVILYFWKFFSDKEKMLNQTLANGSIETTYSYLIRALVSVPNGRIVKESKQSLNIVGSDGLNRIEFFVFQNFGFLEVHWGEINSLGTYKKSWKFQNKYPQENMVQEIANYLQWHQNIFIKAFLGLSEKDLVRSESKKNETPHSKNAAKTEDREILETGNRPRVEARIIQKIKVALNSAGIQADSFLKTMQETYAKSVIDNQPIQSLSELLDKAELTQEQKDIFDFFVPPIFYGDMWNYITQSEGFWEKNANEKWKNFKSKGDN